MYIYKYYIGKNIVRVAPWRKLVGGRGSRQLCLRAHGAKGKAAENIMQ